MRRLALLTTVALLALAGCAGPVADSPATDSATTSTGTPTATDTPTAAPYPDRTVAFPDGPKERPPLPETITRETARDYVLTHEYRYSYNGFWAGNGTEVGLSRASCHVDSTAATGDGYTVVVQCSGYVNEPVEGQTRTRHYDYPPWTVRYYVDGDSVLRTELES